MTRYFSCQIIPVISGFVLCAVFYVILRDHRNTGIDRETRDNREENLHRIRRQIPGGLGIPKEKGLLLHCHFERQCYWLNQENPKDYRWERRSGDTDTKETGPTGDHEERNKTIYLCADATKGKEGDSASLKSITLQPVKNKTCVNFWYHMYGADTNLLVVKIEDDKESKTIFEKKGTQKRDWIYQSVQVTTLRNFTIQIIATRGPGDKGDIAIDEIKVFHCESEWTIWSDWHCPCVEGKQIRNRICKDDGICNGTSQEEKECRCTDWLEWGACPANCGKQGIQKRTRVCPCVNVQNRLCTGILCNTPAPCTVRWSVCSKTCGVGEQTEVCSNKTRHCQIKRCPRGKYLYTEGSTGRPGEIAEFSVLPFNSSKETYCFRFWYHMFGIDIKRFKVMLQLNNKFNWTILNESAGQRERRWFKREVDLAVSTGTLITILFTAIRGNGEMSDIAVDDIAMTVGGCTIEENAKVLECTFDLSQCLVQGKEDDFDWTRNRGSTPSTDTGPDADHTTGSGNKGDQWIEEKRTLPGRTVQVEFTATLSNDYHGDIAIDDVIITEGRCPSQGKWGQWGKWASCSASCNGGRKVRTRSCEIEPCQESNTPGSREIQNCNKQTCPVWGNWDVWSRCNPTCGRASRSRERTCSVPNECTGSPTESSLCPSNIPCQEIWSDWAPWTSCERYHNLCVKNRTRFCLSNKCEDSTLNYGLCNEDDCPGVWSTWSKWYCSVTCDSGLKLRYRTCDIHRKCTGSMYQLGTCNVTSCPGIWAPWHSTGCPVNCGIGTETFTRICPGGNCTGKAMRTAPCSVQTPCTWNSWIPGNCSNPCGKGFQTKTRTCQGNGCLGQSEMLALCDSKCQATLGDWTAWTCNPPCEEQEGGLGRRTRTCTGRCCNDKCRQDDLKEWKICRQPC